MGNSGGTVDINENIPLLVPEGVVIGLDGMYQVNGARNKKKGNFKRGFELPTPKVRMVHTIFP